MTTTQGDPEIGEMFWKEAIMNEEIITHISLTELHHNCSHPYLKAASKNVPKSGRLDPEPHPDYDYEIEHPAHMDAVILRWSKKK